MSFKVEQGLGVFQLVAPGQIHRRYDLESGLETTTEDLARTLARSGDDEVGHTFVIMPVVEVVKVRSF